MALKQTKVTDMLAKTGTQGTQGQKDASSRAPGWDLIGKDVLESTGTGTGD